MVRRPSVVHPHFSKIIFSKTARPIKAKFHMETHWDGGMNVCSRGLCHMPFKNLLQNQRANDLVAWYVEFEPWAHHSLFK